MSKFEKISGSLTLDLTLDEAHILINLVEQLLELLGEGDFFHHYDSSDPLAQLLAMPQEIEAPEDPVLLRLLPNAYSDPEAALDFRRFTEPQLRGSKQRNLRLMREQLTILVDEEKSGLIENIDESLWLKGLTPLRPTKLVEPTANCHDAGTWFMKGGKDRQKNRARTFQGIADAMAEQWG